MRYQNKKLRLENWNYSWDGYYFVTIKIKNNRSCFGMVRRGKMILNGYGRITERYWKSIPNFYHDVNTDVFVIMPDHIHGIIVIDHKISVGAEQSLVAAERYLVAAEQCLVAAEQCSAATIKNKNYGLLSKVVKSFKESVTKYIRDEYADYNFAWQRSYYDRIIRNDKELEIYRDYIIQNPLKYYYVKIRKPTRRKFRLKVGF